MEFMGIVEELEHIKTENKIDNFFKIKAPYVMGASTPEGKQVVVKILQPERNPERFAKVVYPQIKKLMDELKGKTNVCRMRPPKEYKGTHYLILQDYGIAVSEYLRIKKTTFTNKMFMDFASQISLGLAQLQWAGVNHRDVKPSNVIYCRSDELKIIDFDISKAKPAEGYSETTTISFLSKPYASPIRLQGMESAPNSNSFQEDAYSLGVLLCELLVHNRELMREFQKVILSNDEKETNVKIYMKSVKVFLQKLNDIIPDDLRMMIPLLQNLMGKPSAERLDLMGANKYIQLIQMNAVHMVNVDQFFETEVQLAQKRKNQKVAKEHEREFGYIFVHAKKAEGNPEPALPSPVIQMPDNIREEVFHGQAGPKGLYVYSSRTSEVKFEEDKMQAAHCRVANTPDEIYIFGGDDPVTKLCSTSAQGFKPKTGQWKKYPDIPDGGRSLHSLAVGPHHIALVGGFRVNILSALNILVFSIHENQWVSEQVALKQARHHCHACFTNEHLYIFSGTVDGPEDIDFNFARTIERVEINDLLKQKVEQTEEIKIEMPDLVGDWLGALCGASCHMGNNVILICGGMRQCPGELFDVDGFLFDTNHGRFYRVQDPDAHFRMPFPCPAMIHRGHITLATPNSIDAPSFLEGYLSPNYVLEFKEHTQKA